MLGGVVLLSIGCLELLNLLPLTTQAVSARRLPRNDNLGSLIDRYEDSEEFRSCRPKTKKDYCRLLTSIRGKFGDLPIKLLSDRRVRGDILEWRDKIARTSPRQADYTISVFALVLSWAVDRGIISENLLEKPKRV